MLLRQFAADAQGRKSPKSLNVPIRRRGNQFNRVSIRVAREQSAPSNPVEILKPRRKPLRLKPSLGGLLFLPGKAQCDVMQCGPVSVMALECGVFEQSKDGSMPAKAFAKVEESDPLGRTGPSAVWQHLKAQHLFIKRDHRLVVFTPDGDFAQRAGPDPPHHADTV